MKFMKIELQFLSTPYIIIHYFTQNIHWNNSCKNITGEILFVNILPSIKNFYQVKVVNQFDSQKCLYFSFVQ